jgi:hypothetical protein
VDFVDKNPQYLTVNENPQEQNVSLKQKVLSLSKSLDNIKDFTTPVMVLHDRLSRSKIVQKQKSELEDVYTRCMASENFEYTTENETYKLVMDLLMIKTNAATSFKIYIPPSMVGLLLAYIHLLGHNGVKKMLLNLDSYYFPNMYTVTRKFAQSCYSCFLSYTGNKKQEIGVYPLPSRPMEEIMLDLMENLNNVGGYSHILVVMCTLSDFVLLFPLKSKTSAEISRILLYSVCQPFQVRRIHSDNGPGFRSLQFLKELSAIGITVISSSALHPAGRGAVEKMVGTVKILLKKLTATKLDYNWDLLPYIVSETLNNTQSNRTQFKPSEMVFGTVSSAQ